MIIREAEERDIPALERVSALGGSAHRDRVLHDPDEPFRLLVAEVEDTVVGYAFLVTAMPHVWRPRYVPQIVDLTVREDCRGHGIGTVLVRASEDLICAQGGTVLYLAVDPDHNPRALALYGRLGFTPVDTHPSDEPWEYTDSAGVAHRGVDHVIYMRFDLHPRPAQ